MCLIVFAWQIRQGYPLIVAANRDEFYARPSLPLAQWQDAPQIVAGRDLEAGGTWLGISREGRFAALTNVRTPGQPPGRRSRGELPAGFLNSRETTEDYLARIRQHASDYAGFNLLLGDAGQLWYFSPQAGAPRQLQPGIYGLSNANLDTPWPKLQRARQALTDSVERADEETLLHLLGCRQLPADQSLPDTGIGLPMERLLSSVFIASADYGTRASTALLLEQDGHFRISERSFGPHGVPLGEVRLHG